MPSVTRPSDTSLRVSGIVLCLLWMSTHTRHVTVHAPHTFFNTFKLYLFSLCVLNVWKSEDKQWKTLLSLSTVWAPGIEFRSLDLAASVFSC